MSAILKFDFQKRKQLRFCKVNYLNYTKKDPILHVTTSFSLKQGETRTNSVGETGDNCNTGHVVTGDPTPRENDLRWLF